MEEGGDAGVDDIRQGKEGRPGERWLDVGGVDAVLLNEEWCVDRLNWLEEQDLEGDDDTIAVRCE